MAVHFLEEACESTEALELVVQMRPFLDHLGEMGHPLLLRCVPQTHFWILSSTNLRLTKSSPVARFLSTSVGFQYLRQVQYLDQEMELWFHVRFPSSSVRLLSPPTTDRGQSGSLYRIATSCTPFRWRPTLPACSFRTRTKTQTTICTYPSTSLTRNGKNC
jgi:hypothetical protein